MNAKNIYFLGIGGIGMSAIARYFKAEGRNVCGYDRTRSALCRELEAEGIGISYDDNAQTIPAACRNAEETLVVYTPAVPETSDIFQYFTKNNFITQKRAQTLGEITRVKKGLCVAGTHGKTTTSTMAAHLLRQSRVDCSAFLGGISRNYDSNLLLSEASDLVVVEADEFDRSFHHLAPHMAVVTAVDSDHLDIYGTHEAYVESFAHFTSLIKSGGCLIMKKGIDLQPRLQNGVKCYTYSAREKADFCAENVRIGNGTIVFDFVTPTERIADIELGVPVEINVENGVAAMALAWLNGVSGSELRQGMKTFAGSNRRFNFIIKTEKCVLIDDYAHHPEELRASIGSIRRLYPEKKIMGIFQPHLYTRTRDFYADFAASLSPLDSVVLLPIYPAREEPIAGVSSRLILDKITAKEKQICEKTQLAELVRRSSCDVFVTLGAGDIELLVPEVKNALINRV